MIPHFSFTDKSRWKIELDGSHEEKEILRSGQFDHRVIFKVQYDDFEPDLNSDGENFKDKWVKKTLTTTLGEFGHNLGGWYSYHVFDKGDVEEWETQVRKRVAAITADIAALIPPPPEQEVGPPYIESSDWLAHCLFVAMTGTGKTAALRWRIHELLDHLRHSRCSLILMEPKGVLIDELLHLEGVLDIDRVIIDPADCAVAVNPFDAGDRSPQAVNSTIDRLNRIFALLTAGLSPFQTTVMQMAVRAMFDSGREPSMATLMDILESGIDSDNLSGPVAAFFSKRFRQNNRPDARADEIINRLYGMLSSPTFEALFSGETTFDLADAINHGKLIVINASPLSIGGNPKLYARFWIEEAAKAIYPRLKLPEHERLPTYFIIDEAGSYISEDSALIDILARAREAKIGMMLAMQDMRDITDTNLRNAVFTNTALKFGAHTSGEIHDLARAMATTPEFFRTMKRYEFGFFSVGMEAPEKVMFPFIDFTTLPQMSEEQYDELRRLNRERYASTPASRTSSEPKKKSRWD